MRLAFWRRSAEEQKYTEDFCYKHFKHAWDVTSWRADFGEQVPEADLRVMCQYCGKRVTAVEKI